MYVLVGRGIPTTENSRENIPSQVDVIPAVQRDTNTIFSVSIDALSGYYRPVYASCSPLSGVRYHRPSIMLFTHSSQSFFTVFSLTPSSLSLSSDLKPRPAGSILDYVDGKHHVGGLLCIFLQG